MGSTSRNQWNDNNVMYLQKMWRVWHTYPCSAGHSFLGDRSYTLNGYNIGETMHVDADSENDWNKRFKIVQIFSGTIFYS